MGGDVGILDETKDSSSLALPFSAAANLQFFNFKRGQQENEEEDEEEDDKEWNDKPVYLLQKEECV